MKPVLLIDFGSTYTKVTAVDVDNAVLLGTSSAYTTLQYDRRWLAVGLGGTAAVLAVCLWVQRRPQAGKKERRAHHG